MASAAAPTLSATSDNGVQWVAALGLGTPTQSPALLVDTGSDSTWAWEAAFAPGNSSTAAATGDALSESYGTGAVVAGSVFSETAWLDSHGVPGVEIGVADELLAGDWPAGLDGVLGLGPGSDLLASAAASNAAAARSVALALGADGGPEIQLGSYAGVSAAEEPRFASLVSSSAALVLGSAGDDEEEEQQLLLVDSGTSYVGLPAALLPAFDGPGCDAVGSLPRCACNDSTLPTLQFAMADGFDVEVRPEDYAQPFGDDGDCLLMVQPLDAAGFDVVLGAPFFSAYMVYLDYDAGEVGMARLRDPVVQADDDDGGGDVTGGVRAASQTLLFSLAVAVGIALALLCRRGYRSARDHGSGDRPQHFAVEMRRAGLQVPTYAPVPVQQVPQAVMLQPAAPTVTIACPRCTLEQPLNLAEVDASASGLAECQMCEFRWHA